MLNIRTYNAISPKGLDRFPKDKYQVSDQESTASAIMLRSHKLSPDEITESVTDGYVTRHDLRPEIFGATQQPVVYNATISGMTAG